MKVRDELVHVCGETKTKHFKVFPLPIPWTKNYKLKAKNRRNRKRKNTQARHMRKLSA